jgi:hypothetical protein
MSEQTFFVGNTTKQHWTIFFRVPENPKLMERKCVAGGQIPLHKGDAKAMEALAQQVSRYGGVRVDEIDRKRDFIGFCYSIDKPIDATKIARAMDHNDLVLEKLGHENRMNMAAAAHHNLNDIAQQGGLDGRIDNLSAETQEVVRPGDKPRSDGGSERIEVVSEGVEPKGRGGARKRKAA